MASKIPSLGLVPTHLTVKSYKDNPPSEFLRYLFPKDKEITITQISDVTYQLGWEDGGRYHRSTQGQGLSWCQPSLLKGDVTIACDDPDTPSILATITCTSMGPGSDHTWECTIDPKVPSSSGTPTTGTFIAQDSSGDCKVLGFVKSIGDHFKDRLRSENLECDPHSRGHHTQKGESMFKSWLLLIALLSSTANMAASQDLGDPTPKMSPPPVASADVSARKSLPSSCEIGVDRITCTVDKSHRGTSLFIKEADIAKLCGGYDGCSIRLGMYDWDNTGRVASREGLLYYNKTNHAWRSSQDRAGTDWDGVTQHVFQAWACYFTDGKYTNWRDNGDDELGFGLLSWNNDGYDAGCVLTIIH